MTTETGDASQHITPAGLWQGARASAPIGIASAVLGAGFGVAARDAHVSLAATVGMTAAVFAGASQFAALTLWQAPLPLVPIWLSTLAVNARFMLLVSRPSRRRGDGVAASLGRATWPASSPPWPPSPSRRGDTRRWPWWSG